jgi:Uncharacterized conserved protein
MRYPVTLTRDDNDTFLVHFPDVPEAVTFGDTREEALAHASDALLTVIDAYMRDRREIPAPTVRRSQFFVEVPVLEAAKIELYRAMQSASVGKAELARRLHWHLPQVDRVLRMKHGSRLDQVEDAFRALGKRVVFYVEDVEGARAAEAGRRMGAATSRRLVRPTMRRRASVKAR